MAGEELLDRAIKAMSEFMDQQNGPPLERHAAEWYAAYNECMNVLHKHATHDAHRQRAGEGSSPVATDMAARDRDWLINDPATVRVPREPTEAMLRTLADLLVLYLHPDATDLDDLDSRKEQTAYRDTADALWKAMLSAAEAER